MVLSHRLRKNVILNQKVYSRQDFPASCGSGLSGSGAVASFSIRKKGVHHRECNGDYVQLDYCKNNGYNSVGTGLTLSDSFTSHHLEEQPSPLY